MLKMNSLLIKILFLSITAAAAVSIFVYFYNTKGSFGVSASHNSTQISAESTNIKTSDAKKLEDERQKQQALEAKWGNGYTSYNSRNYADCIAAMNYIISQDDKFYKAYTIKGIALCFSSRDKYDEGMKNLDKALEIKSNYGYGIYNKALALELYGHYNDAIATYKKALSIEKFVWSYYGIASIYGRYGDVNNSVSYLKSAINSSANPQGVKDCAKKEPDFNNVKNSQAFQAEVK